MSGVPDPGVLLLVDAANVVGSRPDGWWHDRAGAAARLVAELAPLPGASVSGHRVDQVVVVLEGRARAGVPEGARGGLQVVHAPGSGDDAMVDRCGPRVVLVTADRALADRARAAGAEVVGPGALRAAISG